MTENDEKLAEELAIKYHLGPDTGTVKFDKDCERCFGFKGGFLAGIAHERARNKAKRPEEPTVDFGTFKARVEDL